MFVSAISFSLIVATLGIALDVGHCRYAKRQLQGAADAVAMAGALEVRQCSGVANCDVMQAAATDALKESGFTPGTMLTQCAGGAGAGAGVTLVLNNPVCESSTDPNIGKDTYVEAVVSEPVNMLFSQIVGIKTMTVSAHAEAVRGGGTCIYALDKSGAAITIIAGVIMQSRCSIVDESSSSNALTCAVGAFIYAPNTNIAGGNTNLLCNIQATPHTGVSIPNPADPLAYIPAPTTANDGCGTTTSSPYSGSSSAVNVLLGGNVVFNPGVYCGGIYITAALASNITFNPGTYIIKDKSGFLGLSTGGLNVTVSALSTITGNGVTFYNEGPSNGFSIIEPLTGGILLSVNDVNITAPSSGEYSGILFFQEHGVSAPATFLANVDQGSNLQGAVYVPDGSVNYGVSAISSSYNILVAKDINFYAAVASTFGDDYSSLSSGSPLNGNSATLIQ